MAAEKDNGRPALSDRICQLEGGFAVQADVKQRGIDVFEPTEQEALADTLEPADNAAAGHADDRSHIDCSQSFVFNDQYESIGKIVGIRHPSARAAGQAVNQTFRNPGKSKDRLF
jgi:hypothetical protein